MLNQSKAHDDVACFNDGFNCSQAILSTYCEEFGLDKKLRCKSPAVLEPGWADNKKPAGP